MRITFDDNSYIEFQRSMKAHYVHVIIASRNTTNPLQLVVNSAELQLKQLIEGVKSVSGPVMIEEKEVKNE
jgi:hypothetical protein